MIVNKKLTCILCIVCYTELVKQNRKEVSAYMAYTFPGIDLDDLIYGDCKTTVSER